MKLRIITGLAFIAFALHFSNSAFADVSAKRKHKIQTDQLVAMLPASDGIVTVNVQQFFNNALPSILSGNKSLLTDLISKIDDVKQRTDIDIRNFDYMAAGVVIQSGTDKTHNFEPVIIARGKIDVDKLIAAAKTAANGKYREERFGNKVIYIFATKEIAANVAKSTINDNQKTEIVDKISGEVAVTVLSPNTIAFGKTERIRETIEGKTRISSDLTALLKQKDFAIVNMATKTPAGLSAFLPLENDNLGKSLGSIRYIFGNMDMVQNAAVMNVTARTEKNTEAQTLFETIDGLKTVGGMLLGGSKRPDQQLYARLINNAKVTKVGADVSLALTVPQSDINALVAILHKKKM